MHLVLSYFLAGCSLDAELFKNTTKSTLPSPTIILTTPVESNDLSPTVEVSDLSPQDQISFYTDSNCTNLVASMVYTGGSQSIDFASLTGDGTYTIYYKLNNGACKETGITYTLDTVAPSAPTAISLIVPTSSPSNDINPTVEVSGLVAGDTVSIYTDSSCTQVNQIGSAVSGGATTNITTSDLSAGSYTLYAQTQDAAQNKSACSTVSLNYNVDLTQPALVGVLNDGTYSTSLVATNALSWPTATDVSGIGHYEIKIGTTTINSDILNWTSVGNVTSHTQNSIVLASGSTYYVSVRAVDVAGNVSSVIVSDGWIVDNVGPGAASGLSLGSAPASPTTETPTLSWSTNATDAVSGVASYQVRLFESPSNTQIVDWTSFTSGSQLTSLTLTAGASYYFRLRAIDNAGNAGTTVDSTTFSVPLNPTGTWSTIVVNGSTPSAREHHAAVWTGKEMIIWGGEAGSSYYANGAKYDPVANSWSAISTTGALTARSFTQHVWTGTKMLIWGGVGAGPTNWKPDGAIYDPVTDTWTAMSTTNDPQERYSASSIWTGDRWIIWGGNCSTGVCNSGAMYFPKTDEWIAMIAVNAPTARRHATSVWTGTEMLVWGGEEAGTVTNTGKKFNPFTNTWSNMTTTNAPTARHWHQAVWTGKEMIVWGGEHNAGAATRDNTGGRYNPATDTWVATSTTNAPVGRSYFKAIYTGKEMVVWGGFDSSNAIPLGGATYNPKTDTWLALNNALAAQARYHYSAVYTGREILFWGGGNSSYSETNIGVRLVLDDAPAANTWTTISTTNAPSARGHNVAAWTGRELIIWGGCVAWSCGSGQYLGDGFKFDPASNSWTTISSTNAPTARVHPHSVWTGNKLFIWGGTTESGANDNGKLYDPISDTWSDVSSTNKPTPYAANSNSDDHTFWTGKEVLIYNDGYLFAYNPITDAWSTKTQHPNPSSSSTGVYVNQKIYMIYGQMSSPSGPYIYVWDEISDSWSWFQHGVNQRSGVAVTDGKYIYYFGGYGGAGELDTLIRFDLSDNSATSLTASGVASDNPRAAWTGADLIVFGGFGNISVNNGGTSNSAIAHKYSPSTNLWTALPATSKPASRLDFSMVNTAVIAGGFKAESNGTNSYSAPSYRLNTSGDMSKIIIWGGFSRDYSTQVMTPLNTGAMLQP